VVCDIVGDIAPTRVTTVTGEQSFCTLKFIKSYRRSSMTESRLNDLVHPLIDRDIKLDYNNAILTGLVLYILKFV
jgi:hypothetical protein